MPPRSKPASKRPAAAPLPQPKAMKCMKSAKNDEREDSDDEQEPLTAAAIEKRGLNQKIDLLKKGKIDDKGFLDSLNPKDTQACWKRFEFGRGKNPEARDAWDDMKKLGRGENKDQKKRMLLIAYLKEGKCGDHYMSVAEGIEVNKSHEKNLQWVPWEECKRWYGEPEAKARVAAGTIPVRKCPRDDKYFEFLLVQDSSKLTAVQKRVVETARKMKLGIKEYKALAKGIMSEHDDKMMGDLFNMAETDGKASVSLKDLLAAQSEGETDDESEDLDDELAQAIGGKATAPKPGKKPVAKTNSFDARLAKMSNVGDDTPIDVALAKCSQMHSLISKQVLDIRKTGSVLKKNKLLDPGRGKELESNVEALQKHLEQLDKVVVDRKGKTSTLKTLLINTGKCSRKAKKFQDDVKLLAKGTK